ncbi:hypothetical protein BSKO_05973 [Bryopsis sp. KO-2023]|nr:hypothetical protein BSKO_05973 [Bryopsis sp. KO-2023]
MSGVPTPVGAVSGSGGGEIPTPSTSGGDGGGGGSSPPAQVSLSDIQLVQNLIEKCLQKYMSKEEVVNTLQKKSNIPATFTTLILQQLEQQNPEFFWVYYLRLKLKDQIVLFNYLLDQQNQMLAKMQERFIQGMAAPPPPTPAMFPRPPGMMVPQAAPILGPQMQTQSSQPALFIRPSSQMAPPSISMAIKQEENPTPQIQPPETNRGLPPVSSGPGVVLASSKPLDGQTSASEKGGEGSIGLVPDISSPMDLSFPGVIFGNCSSPDIVLPGMSADLVSRGGLQCIGVGSSSDLQGLVDNIDYSGLDSQVVPLAPEERDGMGAAWGMDLPKIASFSDMAALDFENLQQ